MSTFSLIFPLDSFCKRQKIPSKFLSPFGKKIFPLYRPGWSDHWVFGISILNQFEINFHASSVRSSDSCWYIHEYYITVKIWIFSVHFRKLMNLTSWSSFSSCKWELEIIFSSVSFFNTFNSSLYRSQSSKKCVVMLLMHTHHILLNHVNQLIKLSILSIAVS